MENIPDTPEGIILESLLEGMNQYFSAELSQKVKRGLKESYIKGNFTGGLQIYGYDVVDKKNVINPDEAGIVREIFSKFANGHTGKSISNNLIDRGIRNKQGQYFTDKRVYKILSNPKYIGEIQHGDTVYTNIFPAIIDESTWQAVQLIRNSYKKRPGSRKPIFNYILSGKLICGNCRKFLVGQSGRNQKSDKYSYYICLSRKRYKDPCNFKSLRREWIEDLVINTTLSLLKNNNMIDEICNAVYLKHKNDNKETNLIKSLKDKRESVLKAINNFIKAIEQGIITEQTKTRLKELEVQLSQLDLDIEQAKQRNYSYLTPELIKNYFDKMLCNEIPAENVRDNIVKYLIREVIVYHDKIVITYNFTDTNIFKRTTPDDIDEIEEALKQVEKPASSLYSCSHKSPSASVEMTSKKVLLSWQYQ